MADEPVFLYLATYDSDADAQVDFEAVKALHKDHMIGTYDAAVITKDEHGHVHVSKHEKPTQHAAWTGLAAGAVLGIIFPPSLLVGAAAGGLAGGLIGHFWKGLSRKDVQELGELLDDGEAPFSSSASRRCRPTSTRPSPGRASGPRAKSTWRARSSATRWRRPPGTRSSAAVKAPAPRRL